MVKSDTAITKDGDESEVPDDTPDEIVLEGFRQGLYEAITGQTLPLSQMWEGIDLESIDND